VFIPVLINVFLGSLISVFEVTYEKVSTQFFIGAGRHSGRYHGRIQRARNRAT
jgi:hypothetical protein